MTDSGSHSKKGSQGKRLDGLPVQSVRRTPKWSNPHRRTPMKSDSSIELPFAPAGELDSAGCAPTPGSLRFRVIAYNPETKQDEDCGIIESKSWMAAWATVKCRYNYPKRMIPVTADVIEFPSPANVEVSRTEG